MKRPLSLLPALPAAVGMVAAILLYPLAGPWLLIGLGVAGFAVLFWVGWQYVSFGVLMVAVGALSVWIHEPAHVDEGIFGVKKEYVGRIVEAGERGLSTRAIVEVTAVDGAPVEPFRARITIIPAADFPDGTVVQFVAKAERADKAPETPEETRMVRRNAVDGVQATALVVLHTLRIIEPVHGLSLVVDRVRKSLHDAIVTSPVSPGAAAFMVAVILGDTHYLDMTEVQGYRDAGMAHVLALSGLHVGVIAMLVAALLLPLVVRRLWALRIVATVALVAAYVVLVGASPSVVRAAIMVTAAMVAELTGQRYSGMNALLLSVLLILCFSPMSLYAVGFQLSVAAVYGILLFMPLIPYKWREERPVLYYMASLPIVTVGAVVATAFIAAWYFGTFPTGFLLSNLPAAVLLPWLLGAAIVMMLLTLCGMGWGWFGAIVDGLYYLFRLFCRLPELLGIAPVSELTFNAWAILPYMVAVTLAAFAIRRRSIALGCYAATALCIAGFIVYSL